MTTIPGHAGLDPAGPPAARHLRGRSALVAACVLMCRNTREGPLYARSHIFPAMPAIPSIGYRNCPGHGRDRFWGRRGLIHKQGCDEIVPGEGGLTQKRLDRPGPYPPHSSLRNAHHTSNVDDNRLQMHRIYGYIIRSPGLVRIPENGGNICSVPVCHSIGRVSYSPGFRVLVVPFPSAAKDACQHSTPGAPRPRSASVFSPYEQDYFFESEF